MTEEPTDQPAAANVGKPRTGRPTKFTPERAEAICAVVREGSTLRVAALVNGVAVDTMNEWRRRFPAFAAAVSSAEAEAERDYANVIRTASQEEGGWLAAKFWLTHRRGDDWRPPPETRRIGGDPQNRTAIIVERTEYAGDGTPQD